MVKVSVIIPTYNRSAVVRETIQSVLIQSESDLEVIVVDDGSADDTKNVVESIKDGRVNYLYKDNGGAASARNLGLSKARGKFIAFLDSDDYWPVDYLEVMIRELEKDSDFGAAYSPITAVYPDGRKIISYKKPEGKSGWVTKDLFKQGFVWPSAAVFRRTAWQNFFFDEAIRCSYEDGDAFVRLSMHTKFIFVGEVEAFHRMSDDSIAVKAGVACTRIQVLERFYYQLGGNKIISTPAARRKLSHAYRKVAKDRKETGHKTAALKLYKRAIRYWPVDLRLYPELCRTILLNRKNDPEPDWQMPRELGEPLGTNRFG